MSAEVFAVVLFAALLHAFWNAAMRQAVRRKLPSVAVFIGAGGIAALVVPWFPAPAPASWPYILGSVATHAVYSISLGRAYRSGDFSQSYPLMRGLPPLMTAFLAAAFAGEVVAPGQQVAMVVLCVGILSLVFEPREGRTLRKGTIGWALVVAAAIAVYTTLDGIGVRVSGSVIAYVAWVMMIEAVVLTTLLVAAQGRAPVVAMIGSWKVTLIGGLTSAIGYGLVLWAMTRAPIALVAAARETSVVFAAIIGVVAFRERLTPVRVVSIALVLAGLIAMRIA